MYLWCPSLWRRVRRPWGFPVGEPDTLRAAYYLFGSFAVLGVLGLVAAVLSQRRQD